MRIVLTALALLAALLAVAAIASWWLARQTETRFPPLRETFAATNADLHFVNDGDGPALVLIHGASANLRDFDANLVAQLQDRFRLIRIDRPGSGYSTGRDADWLTPAEQAQAILELLDSLGIRQSIWVGHSWGGSVVMAGLLADPERVRGGVMLAGAAYPWPGGVALHHRLPTWPVIGPLLTHSVLPLIGQALLDGGIESAFAPNEPIKNYAEITALPLYLRPSQLTATATDVSRLSPFLKTQAPRYDEIGNPMLLIHGNDDDIVPAWNHTDRLEKLLPDVEVLRLPDTGHLPHHAHPEQVAKRIASFAVRAVADQH